ncbi:MAG: DUF354 domain-containing protein [Promethearchaeota archaeon]
MIWIDILTPKQAWLLGTLARQLRKENIEVVISARDHGETCRILEIQELQFSVVGKHGGAGLEGKLRATTSRILNLLDFLKEIKDSISCFVSHSSPSGVRTAFGLGIPVISSLDAPHAEAVARLTLPLSDYVLTPKAFSLERYIKIGARSESIVQYDGIDEIAWISQLKPNQNLLKELNFSESDMIVLFRPAETHATYLKGITTQLIRELPVIQAIQTNFPEIKIVGFPRYPEQKKLMEEIKGIIIPQTPIDAPSLMTKAALVISGGGTMIRESALLGIPSLSMFPSYLIEVEQFLISKGLPLWYLPDLDEASTKVLEILKNPQEFMVNSTEIIKEMENPIQVLVRLIKEFR